MVGSIRDGNESLSQGGGAMDVGIVPLSFSSSTTIVRIHCLYQCGIQLAGSVKSIRSAGPTNEMLLHTPRSNAIGQKSSCNLLLMQPRPSYQSLHWNQTEQKIRLLKRLVHEAYTTRTPFKQILSGKCSFLSLKCYAKCIRRFIWIIASPQAVHCWKSSGGKCSQQVNGRLPIVGYSRLFSNGQSRALLRSQ